MCEHKKPIITLSEFIQQFCISVAMYFGVCSNAHVNVKSSIESISTGISHEVVVHLTWRLFTIMSVCKML